MDELELTGNHDLLSEYLERVSASSATITVLDSELEGAGIKRASLRIFECVYSYRCRTFGETGCVYALNNISPQNCATVNPDINNPQKHGKYNENGELRK